MGKFTCVFVPADVNSLIEEKVMTFKEEDEVGCMSTMCQKHFQSGSGTLTPEQKASLKAQIEAQMKAKNQVGEIDDRLLDLMGSTETVDIIPIYPSRPDNNFVGINMYCDDKGVVKGLPVNVRASDIVRVCGKAMQVNGDVFFGRVLDDGRDLFKRQDFLMADLSTSAPWVSAAHAFNTSQAALAPRSSLAGQSDEIGSLVQPTTDARMRAPLSASVKSNYLAKLEEWLQDKLNKYDADENVRTQRNAKYKDRAGYEQFLRKQVAQKMEAETKGR